MPYAVNLLVLLTLVKDNQMRTVAKIIPRNVMVFSFLPKNVHFIAKNAISCLFPKNVLPSKRVACFILNNLHFPMVERGIAFYALHKSLL